MDKRLLTIDMFVLIHGGQKDRGVRVIWHGDNDGIELIAMLCEGLPIVLASEGVRMIFGSLSEVIGIEVAETDDFGEGMTGDLVRSSPPTVPTTPMESTRSLPFCERAWARGRPDAVRLRPAATVERRKFRRVIWEFMVV